MTATPLARAVNAGLRHALETDEKVMLMGEDVGQLGGVFRVTDGLKQKFGGDRVMTSPLGEAGIVGSAIGLALAGYRPICEIQFDGFVYPAMNQIVTQLAKYRHRSDGKVGLPVVVRMPVGGAVGAIEHHSESPESYFLHTAGIRVVTPSNSQDAFDLLRAAIACEDPVVFLEPKRLYWNKTELDESTVDGPVVSLDSARVVREGTDLTLVTYGGLVPEALRAATMLEEEGRSVEVIDLRALGPMDDAAVVASVKRTGRLVVAHEASQTLGLGAELAARVQQRAFYELEAPILRVTGYDTPYPAARLEHDWLPNVDRLLAACDESLAH